MSIQFDRYRLLEDLDANKEELRVKVINYLVQYCKTSRDTASMLAKAVADQIISVDKAVEICKATTGLGEMSGAAGAGAYLPSLHASEKKYKGPELEEDAPMLAHGKADISTYKKDKFMPVHRDPSKIKGVQVKDLWEDEYESTGTDMPRSDDELDTAIDEALNESRSYNKFKKEAATRSKTQQMHEAAKMINRKLDEINKLLEYTNQMRGELSEGEELMEYKSNTKKLFEKINTKVVETYTKVKKLK